MLIEADPAGPAPKMHEHPADVSLLCAWGCTVEGGTCSGSWQHSGPQAIGDGQRDLPGAGCHCPGGAAAARGAECGHWHRP